MLHIVNETFSQDYRTGLLFATLDSSGIGRQCNISAGLCVAFISVPCRVKVIDHSIGCGCAAMSSNVITSRPFTLFS